jgi:hypothetical protein
MNDEIALRILEQLTRLADAAELMTAGTAPNFKRSLPEFAGFDWSSISATVIQSDEYGASSVEHSGKLYTRRSPQNKFGEAVWFSRAVGKDENGDTRYIRLITFSKSAEAEPLPNRTANAIASGPSGPRQPQSNGSRPARPAATPPPQNRPAAPQASTPKPATHAPAPEEPPFWPVLQDGGPDPEPEPEPEPVGPRDPAQSKPAVTPPAKNSAQLPPLTDNRNYKTRAIQMGLSEQSAAQIAVLIGCEIGGDYSPALVYLPFFVAAKNKGLVYSQAKAILVNAGLNLEAANKVLEKTPAAK